jgi:hypothetical protein
MMGLSGFNESAKELRSSSGIAENVKDQDILSLLKGFPLVGRWVYRHKMSVSTVCI